MKQLTIVFDNLGHKELEDYLLTVKGIKEVNVINDEMLEINVTYDPKETNPIVIKTEIVLFLDMAKCICMYSFDKHEKSNKTYHESRTSVCCEYCFKGFVEELFDIDGVNKVNSNFNDFFLDHDGEELSVDIEYDSTKVKEEQIKEVVNNLSE